MSLPLARWCSSADVELLGRDEAARDHHFADARHAARPIEPQRLGGRCALARVESPGHGASSVIAGRGSLTPFVRHPPPGLERAADRGRVGTPLRGRSRGRRWGSDAPSARLEAPKRALGHVVRTARRDPDEPGGREPVPAAASSLKATAEYYVGRDAPLIERRLASPSDRDPCGRGCPRPRSTPTGCPTARTRSAPWGGRAR